MSDIDKRFLPSRAQIRQAATMQGFPADARTPEMLDEIQETMSQVGPTVPPFAIVQDAGEDLAFFREGDDTMPFFSSQAAAQA